MRRITIKLLSLAIAVFFTGQVFAADIVPTAGMVQSFAAANGDVFYDHGGPGGDCVNTSTGAAGDYLNCTCTTTTTITGVNLSVTFTTFAIWNHPSFDNIKIYDGTDNTGTLLCDTQANGPTAVLLNLAGFMGQNLQTPNSALYTSATGALTFEFYSSGAINACGWSADVSTGGVPPPPPPPPQAPCTLTCPPDLTVTVDPDLCVGIVNVTAPPPTGDCAGGIALLSAANEDYSVWNVWTNSTANNTTPGGCGAGSGALFSRLGTNGYCQNPPVAQPNFDDTQLAIDDDEANPIGSIGEFCWESPVLDLSMGGIAFNFDWQYRDLGAGFPFAEVYDGTSWVNVWSGGSFSSAGSQSVNLGAYSNSDFQVRVCLDDGNSWGWGAAFDNIEVLGASAVPIATNDFDGGTDLINAEFPLGTTTVTYTTFDASGNVVSCNFDVTVLDPGPFLTCPGDFTVTLDPGLCEYYYNYVVDVKSCAGLVSDTICQTAYQWDNLDIDPALSLSCSAPPTSYWRVYDVADLGLAGDPAQTFEFVTAWFRNSGNQTADARVYDYTGGPVGDVLDLAFATEIASGSLAVSGIITDSANIPVSYFDYSLYETILVEVVTNQSFTMAQTLSTTTEPSWLSSAPCGITTMPQRPGTGALAAFANNYAFLAPLFCYIDLGDAIVQGVPSGDPIPIGTTTFEYYFEDVNGVGNSCTWDVTVVDFPDPITDFACNDEVNISPDGDCEVLITPDMILEGGPYSCYDNYVVTITDLDGNPVANPVTGDYAGQTLIVVITDPNSDATCWGYANIEDKLIPDLECGTYEAGCDDDISPGLVSGGSTETSTDMTPGSTLTAGAPVDLEFPVSQPGTFTSVTDVNISYDISHTWIGDVRVVITSPSGTSIRVIDNIGPGVFGCIDDDIDITMDDQATLTYADLDNMCDGSTPYATGTYQPENPMAGFNGEEANGNWIVTVSDQFGGDDGTLNFLNLTINASSTFGIPLPLPADAVATPNGDNSYIVTGFDPCGPVDLVYNDEVIDIDCTLGSGYTTMVLRHWTATDPSGNSTSCTDTIRLRAATLGSITLPADRDNVDAPALECHGSWDNGCDGIPNTGDYGEADNIPQPCEIGDEVSALCDIWANYTDTEFSICGYSKKIFREWYILDKCTGEFTNHTQVILILDTDPPVINCPARYDIGTDPYSCGGTWQVPPPDASDICSGIASWSVTSAAGTVIYLGGTYTITGLPEGCTEVTYTVYDGCGNEAYCTTEVCVVDEINPVAICDLNTQVSLGTDGRARIYAETFDDGSYDNCGIKKIEVRRTSFNSCWNTFAGPYVEFCCDDIANSPIEVELIVTDYADNVNRCWVNVLVEDKLNPVIVCPPDITVSCDYKFDLNNLHDNFGRVVVPQNGEVRGDIYIDDIHYQEDCLGWVYQGTQHVGQDGYAVDNCNVTVTDIANVNLTCGKGVITRIFTATDDGGRTASCIQRITIVDCDPFYIADTDSRCRDRGGVYTTTDDVEWPCDVTLDGCSGAQTNPDYTGRPDYEDDKCSLIADTFVDEVFTIVDDACFKILRHWSIIDWCQEDPSTGLPLRWDYTQVIKVIDEEGPIVTPADPGCDENATDCGGNVNLAPEVEDCTPAHLLVYWWRIDIGNDGLGPLPGGFDFEGTTSDPSGVYPYGTHRILWVIEDMCGNRSTTEYTFDVEDCKKPSPVCINGLSSVVMPSSGQITVWAVDFDASSFDNCDNDLDFRIWYDYMDSTSYPDQSIDWQLPTAGSSGADVLFYLPSGAVFYCEALGNGQSRTFTVRIYVVDDAGNWDYCTTNITIDDNDDVCPDGDPLHIAGGYTNEEGETVDNVMTELTGGHLNQVLRNQMVDDNGEFAYIVSEGYNWNVTGEKDDAYLNGVTAQDLSLIQRHIAGIDYLNSNYKLVAADANADTDLDIRDVLDLRKLLLGIYDELPNNKSWRTIDADYTFPGITNNSLPTDVYDQEMISYQAVAQNMLNTDFIGVKVGDVDGDATPNSFVEGEERGGNKALTFSTLDATFAEGDVVTVNFTAENFNEVSAYQFTFGFDQSVLEFVGSTAGALNVTEGNFGTQYADRGIVTTVWYAATAQSVNNDEVLFTLTFRANGAGNLSSVINVGSTITDAIAFSNETGKTDVDLQFNTESGEVVGDAFALFQNTPNPFADVTTIGYVLPEAAEVTLTVYDMSGRVMNSAVVDGAKGINHFELNRSEIPAAGVLYYQVETDGYSATKKMVVVE